MTTFDMTDEERQKLILQRLDQLGTIVMQLGTIGFYDPDIVCKWIFDGHDEIERLTKRIEQLEKAVEALGRM